MNLLPKTPAEILERFNYAQTIFRERNELVKLCREMYAMKRDRTSTFLGERATAWRRAVAPEYWCSSNRVQNAVDIATAILSGYPPQYRVTIPGSTDDVLPSRAEKFLLGVWRANSRRCNADLFRRICFRCILDGAVVVRVTWDVNAPEPQMRTIEAPDGDAWVVATYPDGRIPLRLDVLHWDRVYPIGAPVEDTPFSEIVYAAMRPYSAVYREWSDVEGATMPPAPTRPTRERGPSVPAMEREALYLEWWGYDDNGDVHYMVVYDGQEVLPRRAIGYPCIPFVIGAFKEVDHDTSSLAYLPFVYPILWSVEREEYMRSRVFRIVDMLANLPPVHRGATPLSITGTWGEIINLTDERERIEFPQWPGNPPDVWRVLEDIDVQESQGTFSSAMYGQVSSRISGYGLSQLIGADTLRMDTPRSNFELLYGNVGEMLFRLLRAFSYHQHIATTVQVRGRTLESMLAGRETEGMVVDAYLKQRQASDEQRLAIIGAQLASLPKPPVSMDYILEHYFGIAQPEDEKQRVMADEIMRDPLVRLIAMANVLQEQGSPYAPVVLERIMSMVQQKIGGEASGGGRAPEPEELGQVGMGMPQAVMGNPVEEQGMGLPFNMREGGPIDEMA